MPILKTCPQCKRELPLTPEFWYRCRKEPSGFHWWCKDCKRKKTKEDYAALTPEKREAERLRKQAWEAAHREQVRERQAKFREENREAIRFKHAEWRKEHEEQLQEQQREWAEANRDKIREAHRNRRADPDERAKEYAAATARREANIERERQREAEYRENNRDALRANARKWAAKNMDKIRVQTILYRARKRGAPGKFGLKDIEEMYGLQLGLCHYCRGELNGKFEVDHAIPLSRGGTNERTNLVLACASCNRKKNDKLPSEFKPSRPVE